MDKHGVETWLQVDGGVSLETIERCAEAGADVFVAGSAVYSADDPDRMIGELRAAAEGAAPDRLSWIGRFTARTSGASTDPRRPCARTRRRAAPLWQTRPDEFSTRVLWGRCNSEPAVTDREIEVRDPVTASDRLTR